MIRSGMILAAGFGTRLRPLTRSIPKPMIPLCNRPLIGWALESLIRAGVTDVVVNLHHQPASIEEWLPRAAGTRATVEFTHEDEILGTGGGIRNARRLLDGRGHFALVNGDTVQNPPISALAAAREEHDALAALLLRTPPADDRFTPVYFDHGTVTGFGEGTGDPLMFAGAHVISERIFDLLPDQPFSGIVEHAYIPALQVRREVLAGVHEDGWWFDIGTPRRLLVATRTMLGLIISGAVAPPIGSTITARGLHADDARGDAIQSVLGSSCRVAPDALVERSLLLDGAVAHERAVVRDSILGPGVEIRAGMQLDNAFVCVRRGDEEEGEEVTTNLVALPVDPARPWRAD